MSGCRKPEKRLQNAHAQYFQYFTRAKCVSVHRTAINCQMIVTTHFWFGACFVLYDEPLGGQHVTAAANTSSSWAHKKKNIIEVDTWARVQMVTDGHRPKIRIQRNFLLAILIYFHIRIFCPFAADYCGMRPPTSLCAICACIQLTKSVRRSYINSFPKWINEICACNRALRALATP